MNGTNGSTRVRRRFEKAEEDEREEGNEDI